MKKVKALLISIPFSLRLPLFIVLFLTLFLTAAPAATYYVDSSRPDDSGDGQSPETAWKTLAKVNGGSFAPGDFVLLKRGGVWREQLTVPSSGIAGFPITFGAYGTGANPKIYRTDSYNNWWEHSLIENAYCFCSG